ncbi:MAG: 30S ribosomal protein S18 [Candidatus Paceibacterota bacterium]|jgi:small subunit ribosomal protein S18|nr:30S ribosomal protein S18 [Candidatus Paceibacterota bacterium]HQM34798.1 30S ribosomal protein S18 [Candidatus Paceibacterota bacterium]
MKQCFFCSQNVDEVDYKDVELLPRFLTLQSKIIPAKKSGLCRKHQQRLTKAVKRARYLGLIKYQP